MPADEFANIPSPRRRHPLLALGAAALAVFLLYQIHDDLFYALSHAQARDVGEARTVAATPIGQLPINEYVRLTGTADRESGVIIDTAGSWRFTQFFRLLGTKSRIFVSRVPDPIPVEQAERDVFVGRLMRFRDLSFEEAIRKHFANRVTATHFFSPAVLRQQVVAAPGGPLTLADLMGEKVVAGARTTSSPSTWAVPADVRVEMPRAKWPDEAAARAAVEQQGGRVLDEAGGRGPAKSVALVVTFPEEARDQAMHAVSELDPRIRFLPVRSTYSVRVADLAPADDGLRFRTGEGEQGAAAGAHSQPSAPWPTCRSRRTRCSLREGERPRDHVKVLLAGAFLLLAFALVNLLSLRVRA